ncbi:MAG: hypothetical protein Hyperionvirus12_45 [Hyperionvirus sp.]|uniref:Bro-N domain-containing protein n=1 Tax=Hyperionvirus sp. TaxID=2487770 RepID=A0A3G5A9A9_9VIRU|nr:MAG: hypothetical protein Hyperionvirus12_45 [Hyperionvirus sp.]
MSSEVEIIKNTEVASDTITQDSNVSMPSTNFEDNTSVEVKPTVKNKIRVGRRIKVKKEDVVPSDEKEVEHSDTYHAFVYGEHTLNLIWIGDSTDKKLKNTGWYRAKDCTHIFGFKNILEMIKQNVSTMNYIKAKTLYKKIEKNGTFKLGDRMSTLYVRDEGLYELIPKSEMENPKEFKAWIKNNTDQLKSLLMKKKSNLKKEAEVVLEPAATAVPVTAAAPVEVVEVKPVHVKDDMLEHGRIVNQRLQIVSDLIMKVLDDKSKFKPQSQG